jgi:hypothetical protein
MSTDKHHWGREATFFPNRARKSLLFPGFGCRLRSQSFYERLAVQSSRPYFRPLTRAKFSLELRSFLERLEGERKFRPKLIFLCGGNSDSLTGGLSYRRKMIVEFLMETKEFYPVIAEEVFAHYKEKNPLDIENDISSAADRILIVLESPSAFVELGAFSSDDFRRKLIVINDSSFREAPSFINLGPIKQIREINEDHVIYYRFQGASKDDACPIAEIFPKLILQLRKKDKKAEQPINTIFKPLSNKIHVTPLSLMFLHDVISILGPLTLRDLIDAYQGIYDKSIDLSNFNLMIGLLISMKFINPIPIKPDKLYESSRREPFFHYDAKVHKLSARAKLEQRKIRGWNVY